MRDPVGMPMSSVQSLSQVSYISVLSRQVVVTVAQLRLIVTRPITCYCSESPEPSFDWLGGGENWYGMEGTLALCAPALLRNSPRPIAHKHAPPTSNSTNRICVSHSEVLPVYTNPTLQATTHGRKLCKMCIKPPLTGNSDFFGL